MGTVNGGVVPAPVEEQIAQLEQAAQRKIREDNLTNEDIAAYLAPCKLWE